MLFRSNLKNLEALSITKVTIYRTEKGKKKKEKKKKSMIAKTKEIVKKEGRQLSFNLFYYLDTSQKKRWPKK